MKHLDWKQAAKASAFAFIGRLAAEVLIYRYRASFTGKDRLCPHIIEGKPVKLRIILNEDWYQFCAVCTNAYHDIFEMASRHRSEQGAMVVGIKHIGKLRESQPRKADAHAEQA